MNVEKPWDTYPLYFRFDASQVCKQTKNDTNTNQLSKNSLNFISNIFPSWVKFLRSKCADQFAITKIKIFNLSSFHFINSTIYLFTLYIINYFSFPPNCCVPEPKWKMKKTEKKHFLFLLQLSDI